MRRQHLPESGIADDAVVVGTTVNLYERLREEHSVPVLRHDICNGAGGLMARIPLSATRTLDYLTTSHCCLSRIANPTAYARGSTMCSCALP